MQLFRGDDDSRKRLGEREDLMDALLQMGRAQQGETVSLEDVLAGLDAQRQAEEDAN